MSSLELALQRLLAEAHPRKERDLVEALQGAMERLQAFKLAMASSVPRQSMTTVSKHQTPTTSMDEPRPPSTPEPAAIKASSSIEIDAMDAEEYWNVFKLACTPSVSNKVKVLALDALHKLIAHGKLTGDAPLTLPPATRTTPASSSTSGRKFAAFSETNDLSHIDCSDPKDHPTPNLPGANTVGPDHYPDPPRLLDEIVHTICMTFRGPGSTDDNVQLQVIKILLTIVTSTTCHVHHVSLLKIIQTSCNIYCWTKSPILQATAKAGLTQMVNLVISKMETDAHTLRDIEKTLEQHSIAIQQHPPSESGRETPISAPDLKERDLQKPITVESIVDTEEDNIPTETITTHPETKEESEQIQEQEPLQEPGLEEQQKDSHPISSSEAPLPSTPALERTPSLASQATTIAQAGLKSKELILHEVTIAACRVSRQDVYLTFRLLCKLSLRADIMPTNAQQEEASIRGRALVLELILSMMNNSGPVFQSDDLFVGAVRQYLCVSLSQNGVSANETLFEFSLSLFLTVLRYYRAQLKAEVEVLFNEFYLKLLDMSNATPRQKEMVLQGLHKICSNPQSLVDIYLNFDCDFSMASIFEHIVNSLSRIAQGRGKANASATVGNMMGKQLLLNEKDAWTLIQDRRLAVQGLRCMVSVLDSLVDWSKDVSAVNTLPEAIAAANASMRVSTNGHARDISSDLGPTT
ncbi:Brefeldin A-inhibited guanine nucleotide-exchange protein 2, partial [Modicella reniformis]